MSLLQFWHSTKLAFFQCIWCSSHLSLLLLLLQPLNPTDHHGPKSKRLCYDWHYHGLNRSINYCRDIAYHSKNAEENSSRYWWLSSYCIFGIVVWNVYWTYSLYDTSPFPFLSILDKQLTTILLRVHNRRRRSTLFRNKRKNETKFLQNIPIKSIPLFRIIAINKNLNNILLSEDFCHKAFLPLFHLSDFFSNFMEFGNLLYMRRTMSTFKSLLG